MWSVHSVLIHRTYHSLDISHSQWISIIAITNQGLLGLHICFFHLGTYTWFHLTFSVGVSTTLKIIRLYRDIVYKTNSSLVNNLLYLFKRAVIEKNTEQCKFTMWLILKLNVQYQYSFRVGCLLRLYYYLYRTRFFNILICCRSSIWIYLSCIRVCLKYFIF